MLQTLGSTQDLCVRLGQRGQPDGVAVLARRQVRGRGSRSRMWQDLAGNLAISVLLRPRTAPSEAGQWALLAGVALLEALAPHAPPGSLSLKWPNDLRMSGRKLAGLLLETSATGQRSLDWLVIGAGANLATAPDLPGAIALSAAPDPVTVARAFLAQLDQWRTIQDRHGFAPVRQAWLDRAGSAGTRLHVRGAGLDVAGEFAGLSDDGALLLSTGGRVLAVNTGEILQAEG